MLMGRRALQERYRGSGGATRALAQTGAVSGGFPKEVTFIMRQEAKKKGRHAGWGRESFQQEEKEMGNGRRRGTLLDPFSLSLGLGSTSTHCPLSPCCHLGSLPEEWPSFASFIPPFPSPLSSGSFLAPLLPEQQFPGSPTTEPCSQGPCALQRPGVFQAFPGWLGWARGLARGSGSCSLGQRGWR